MMFQEFVLKTLQGYYHVLVLGVQEYAYAIMCNMDCHLPKLTPSSKVFAK